MFTPTTKHIIITPAETSNYSKICEKMNNTFASENVNGVVIRLSIESKSELPKSRNFCITFGNSSRKSVSVWSKTSQASVFLAVIFNIFSLVYIRISLTAFMIIMIILSFLVFFWITHSVQSESLLVIPSVGVQSSVKYVFGREDNFVPWNTIDDVIINEVIKSNRVLYFLTMLVKAAPDSESISLIPLFKYTKPRLQIIEKIYAELQTFLMDSTAAMGSGDNG